MKESKIKRDFSTKVRQPFQDAVALILHIIDYHNSFVNDKFHRRQARVLKWYLLDLKEWIVKEESRESLRKAVEERKIIREQPLWGSTEHDESDDIEAAKQQEADYTDGYWKREVPKEDVEWNLFKLEGGGFIRKPVDKTTEEEVVETKIGPGLYKYERKPVTKKEILAGPDKKDKIIEQAERYFRKGEKWEKKYEN